MYIKEKQNIEDFWIVGVNYKKSDAAVRGLFAVNHEQYNQLLVLAPGYGLSDIFVLSTCNRTEIYGFANSASQLAGLLCSVSAGDAETFANISYSKNGTSAIEHLYQVAAGLDSQILGDYEILGQIKSAVKHAKASGFIGAFLERLVNSVIQASKAVKTNTGLSGGTVSVSFAAIQCIKGYLEFGIGNWELEIGPDSYLGELENRDTSAIKDKKIVVIGMGKMGRNTCKNLVDYLATTNITLINRTEETAVALAKELKLRSAAFETLENELGDADIVLVSTSAPDAVILKRHLEGKGKKLVIDMSVPSNVEVAAQQLPGITFVDVDMLSKINDDTLQNRRADVPKAIAIIHEHIAEFNGWYAMRKHVPVLKEVKNKLKEIPAALLMLNEDSLHCPEALNEEKIQKVINSLATKMRRDYAPGCHYIEAINDFIA